ncbi:MAG: helix-turn-helix transcriptional regulator [Lentisphaeria bacterium]|nr:helix-turn-helix transcriptional regulator [Lentisphaeria bacterium]
MQNMNIGPEQVFDGVQVRLLRVATGAITPGAKYWHLCGYPEFILIRAGALRTEFRNAPGKFLERPAHSIIHFPQDSVRRTLLAAGECAPYVSLKFSARTDSLFDLFPLLRIPDFIRAEEAEGILCRLAQLAGSADLAEQLEIQELLLRFLRIVVRESRIREDSLQSCREPWFREVSNCIASRLRGHLTPEELVKHSGMSRQSFYAKFKRATGFAPLEYVTRKRLREAEIMLLNGDGSIAEIAEALHFTDQFHFSHLFKRVYGISPLNFRKSAREKTQRLCRAAGETP